MGKSVINDSDALKIQYADADLKQMQTTLQQMQQQNLGTIGVTATSSIDF